MTDTLKNWIQSPKWFWAFVVSLAACALVFLANVLLSEVKPSNNWGMGYGIAAAVLMVGIALFGARRRLTRFTKKLGAGRAQSWVQFHVYGGTIFLLLVLMHSGFRLPTGTLAWWLFGFSVWVSLSGIVGVFLQKWIPKILTSGLSIEVLYERIPELVGEIRDKSEEIILRCTEPVREFYRRSMAPALVAPQVRFIYYIDITGGIQAQVKQLDYLSKLLSSEDKDNLNQLESFYRTKLELDAHYTLQKALRLWLYLHVPASLILLLLAGLHIYSILYY